MMSAVTVTYSKLGSMGRCGNALFEIAGSLAIARQRGEDLSLPDWPYRPYFSIPDEIFDDRPGVEAWRYAQHLGEAAPYLQDLRLVDSVADEVRAWFAPSELSRSLIRSFGDDHTTAVHVRRGDFLRLRDYYRVPDVAWYVAAMRLVRQTDLDTRFLVFSDDPQWCREHLLEAEVLSVEAPEGWVEQRDHNGHPLPHPTEMADFWTYSWSC